MDVDLIVELYEKGDSMRSIADKLDTNHKLISRILKKSGVQTRRPKNLRGVKKFNCDIERNYNNMATHLRFDVSVEWLMKFNDFDKLKLLNNVITNRSCRWDVSSEWYMSYIERFYDDDQFNKIYETTSKEFKSLFFPKMISQFISSSVVNLSHSVSNSSSILLGDKLSKKSSFSNSSVFSTSWISPSKFLGFSLSKTSFSLGIPISIT